MPTEVGIHDFFCFGEGKSWVPSYVGMTGGGTEEPIIWIPGKTRQELPS